GYDVAVFDIDHDGANDVILGRAAGTFVWMNEASPVFCQEDLGYGGPGPATLSVCGPALESGKSATLLLENALPLAPAILAVGFRFDPTPFAGGIIVPVPPFLTVDLTTDATGQVSLTVPGGLGPFEAYAQMGVVDPTQPGGYQISNAVLIEQLP
ncbi:MAG: hypothetical protein O7B99_01190, partial [Planctomycetota bacterium]|nr:hypothetical protein [Planctomycetota bacterium]